MSIGSFLGFAIMICMPLNLAALLFFYLRKVRYSSLSAWIVAFLFVMIVISLFSVWVFLEPDIDVHAHKYLFGSIVLAISIASLLVLKHLLSKQELVLPGYFLLLDINVKAIIGIFGLVYVELALALFSLYVVVSLLFVNHDVAFGRKFTWIIKSVIILSGYAIVFYLGHLIFKLNMLDFSVYTTPIVFASFFYGVLFFFGGLISLVIAMGGDVIWGLKKLKGLNHDPKNLGDYSK